LWESYRSRRSRLIEEIRPSRIESAVRIKSGQWFSSNRQSMAAGPNSGSMYR
jgi:hypothetical protein